MKDMIWFNQNLLSYKDCEYSQNSFLSLFVSTSTENWKDFNDPKLCISINNDNKKYTFSLKIYEVFSLLNSFEEVSTKIEDAFNKNYEICRKVSNKLLRFAFKISKKNERIIIIAIVISESDFVVIVINPNLFETLKILFKSFVENYLFVSSSLIQKSILISIKERLNFLERNINEFPLLIKEQFKSITLTDQDVRKSNKEISPNNFQETFDSFVGSFDNLIGLKPKTEKTSKLVVQDLFEDIAKFEQYVSIIYIESIPFLSFIKYISIKIAEIKSAKEYLLPSISEKDYKSILYISSLLIKDTSQKYFQNKENISNIGIPILKYKCLKSKKENIELASQFLVLVSYLKVLSSKLSNKVKDSISNKSLLYVNSRMILDPLIFSFINKDNFDLLLTSLKNIYLTLCKNKYFESFNKYLENYGCSEIKEYDITSFLNVTIRNVLENCKDISDIHNQLKVKILRDNILDFTLEQINEELTGSKSCEESQKVQENTSKDIPIKNEKSISKEISKSNTVNDWMSFLEN